MSSHQIKPEIVIKIGKKCFYSDEEKEDNIINTIIKKK